MKTLYLSIIMLSATSFASLAQTADFTYSAVNNEFCSPAMVNFTQACTGNPTAYLWNFGNNSYSSAANPSFNFDAAGNYTVSLTAFFGGSGVTVTKTITIDTINAITISVNKNFVCNEDTVNFTATAKSNLSHNTILSYVWNAGDGSGDTATYSNVFPHYFIRSGNYVVTVKAINSLGCPDTGSVRVTAVVPEVGVGITPHNGCAPATVLFSAKVTLPALDSVANYTWTFGDGTAVLSTGINNTTQHVYALPDSYFPVLQILTKLGCTVTDSLPKISYGLPPLGIKASPQMDTVCGSDSIVVLYNTRTADTYQLRWGDGSVNYVPATGYNIFRHKYDSLGRKTITIIPYDHGCQGNDVVMNVFIKGVIAAYSFADDCARNTIFHFSNTSQGKPTSIEWRFGDGDSTSNNYDPTYTYANTGVYAATMFIADSISVCSDTMRHILYASNPALTTGNAVVCRGTTTTFNIINNANPASTYDWYIESKNYGIDSSTSFTTVSDSAGSFNNYVIMNGGAGYCVDTVKESKFTVKEPFPLSDEVPGSLCANSVLQVINLSPKISGTDTVKQWFWSFNNITYAAINNDTTYQPQPYIYAIPGAYKVTLSVIDQYGCADSLVKPISVNPFPFLETVPLFQTLCLGQFKPLMAFHTDSLRWSPAGLVSCISCDTTLVSPTATTSFIATATNQFGCAVADTAIVQVYSPFKAVPLFSDTAVCANVPVELGVSPSGKQVIWSPSASLSADNIYNPIATPAETTMYQVILSDSAGCFSDTAAATIQIKTAPQVDAGPDAAYPYHSEFSFQPTYSANVASYQWSPAASLSCSPCAFPQGVANNSQTYWVTVTSDSGCVAKDSVTIFVTCANSDLLMPTAFTPNNDGLNDLYYPIGRGIKIIKKFAIYNRGGQMVFEQENFPPNQNSYGWNGKLNGYDQPSGTYVFMVESICDQGEDVNQQGTLVLVR